MSTSRATPTSCVHVQQYLEFLGAVCNRIIIQLSEVKSRIMLETRGDDGVMLDARCKARRQLRERTARVREQESEVGKTVKDARKDQARRSLEPA